MSYETFLALAGGYLLGGIPFGLVLTRLAGYGDIRKIGSGNIGATNVLRTGNRPLAALTLLLDGGKGALAVLIAALLATDRDTLPLMAGLGAVIGHIFPLWLRFRGGKGVATTLGTVLAMTPSLGVLACCVWLVTAALFRYSSLSALTALAMLPPVAFFVYDDMLPAVILALIAALVWERHRANIARLMNGTEPKIGQKKAEGQKAQTQDERHRENQLDPPGPE